MQRLKIYAWQVAELSSFWDGKAMSNIILTLATWRHRLSKPACQAVTCYLQEHGAEWDSQVSKRLPALRAHQTASTCLVQQPHGQYRLPKGAAPRLSMQ